MSTYSSAIVQEINSGVSYTDILGLYLGLTRFVGETNTDFLQRLYKSSIALKDTSVQGLIDTISLNLNLSINKSIQISGPDKATIVILPGILLLNNVEIPLFNLAGDTYMEWLMLSEVVAAINNVSGWSASLLISDRPALTLCKQSNINFTLNELVTTSDLVYNVDNKGLVASSIIFSTTPPTYTVSENQITFNSSPPDGLTITYQNIIAPYTIIASDVNPIALTEPTLISKATTTDNVLAYQLREALQNIMTTDASYWAI